MNTPTSSSSETLLRSLQNPALYDHEVQQFEMIETHISWVLLTGPYAYKMKKPVNLGFLDFSTLEQRRFFCEEELRLNQRLAPEFYLELVTITGTAETPSLNGSDEPLEYAVKMKQFPQDALLSRRIQDGHISSAHIDELARCIAEFHTHIAVADSSSTFGTPDVIKRNVMDNFQHLLTALNQPMSTQQLEHLKQWTEAEHAKCIEDFLARKTGSFIRECHGDLHLGNIALVKNKIVIFDCIEFNERFRWIDVMSEIAFVVMDLIDRGAPSLGWRLLNTYLEQTGDYDGIIVLRYYLTYRSMVRAKVTGIRLEQEREANTDQSDLTEDLNKYLTLATSFTHPINPVLIVMHGLSGSGKTTVSQTLLESFGAIRIRSDIERKYLLGLSQSSRTDRQKTALVYSEASTQATYAQLEMLGRNILQSGFSVIVDATFLKHAYRNTFAELADELGLLFLILDIRASAAILRQRVMSRLHEGCDASEADLSVLEQQFSQDEPFTQAERPFVIEVDTEHANYLEDALTAIQQRVKTTTL